MASDAGGDRLLEVDGLTIAYGDIEVVHGVSFSMPRGGMLGILGSNGAGKTTILRAISGLVRPRSGDVVFRGQSLTRIPPHRIPSFGIAHVPEGRGTFPSLSVIDNLLLGSYAKRDGRREERLQFVMQMFPWIKLRAQQRAGSLSGGEQQMLAIGRALMLWPELLILDEPSLGLAPIIVEEVFAKLAEIHQGWQLSILLVEQNAVEAMEIIDHAVVVENGRLAFSGTREELAETPFIRQAYLGA